MQTGISLRICTIILQYALFTGAGLWFCGACYSQQRFIAESFDAIEHNPAFSSEEKLSHLYQLKERADSAGFVHDTVYAKILGSIGLYEFLEKNNFDAAIRHTLSAAAINMSVRPIPALFLAAGNYFNLGFYYDKAQRFSKALAYYDTAIIVSGKVKGRESRMLDARIGKIYIYFRMGDYQKSVEESTGGIITALELGDSLRYLDFLNQRGQALFFQNQSDDALSDIESVISVAQRLHQPHRLASAYKMKGFIYARRRNLLLAQSAFKDALEARKQTKDIGQIAGDCNDFGNFCFDSLKNLKKARRYYGLGMKYAAEALDSVRLARLSLNIGRTCIEENDFKGAEEYLSEAFAYLGVKGSAAMPHPSMSVALSLNQNKELLLYILENKTYLLLRQYQERNAKVFLQQCLAAALLTDSVITQLRHEQVGEQSKLYWRDRTRSFFATALKASYLDNNAGLAFFFMEKSRAVLLNDKLNELGAMAHLPEAENNTGQEYKLRLANEEQRLNALPLHSAAYRQQQLQVLKAKETLQQYIKALEQNYPAYYQYKYADKVPDLAALQAWLSKNKQSFVHYFTEDGLTYILAVTPDTVKMINPRSGSQLQEQANALLRYCTNKQQLNNDYAGFAALSHTLYKDLFEPLQLPPGRVILCTDNFLFPFEALCKDDKGTQYLLYDYAFSYVYAAGYLLKEMDAPVPKGNFIGFAPVSFALYLGLPDLKKSSRILNHIASHYNTTALYTGSNASRSNFMKAISGYSIANLFSHALADTGSAEPLLYMQDSVIHLSELQLLSRPATRLIMLSACETNAGRNAAGEGIYSLARGFSLAGIPAVAATLWKADEEAVYTLSDKFHQYLSEGMCKDEALQKAKLYFISRGDKDKLLPYYWANMVLMGNADPIRLRASAGINWWLLVGVAVLAGWIMYAAIKKLPFMQEYWLKKGK